MRVNESIKEQIEKFKNEVIAIAEQYEENNRNNMLLINEITSRRDWKDLNTEAQDRKKKSALTEQKEKQMTQLDNRISKFEKDLETFEQEITAEIFKELTGSEKLKKLADQMGVSPELANSLLEDVAGLQSATDMLNARDSFTDLVLRKQMRDGGKELTEQQKEAANKRINSEGSEALMTYQYVKNMLGSFKGQLIFVRDSNLQYSPDDLEKMNIMGIVKEGLKKAGLTNGQ